MRVIAGRAKGKPLKAPRGIRVRPTSDKVKEAYFSIVGEKIVNSSFLDLFAGTGGMGIEALSRGAQRAVFVENNRQALQALRENLQRTGLSGEAEVIGREVFRALHFLAGRRDFFDLIYIDPFYDYDKVPELFAVLRKKELVSGGGLVCLERAARQKEDWQELSQFQPWKTKHYGNTVLEFFSKST